MKRYFFFTLSVLLSISVLAQTEIDKSIAEAQGYLKQKNYKDAQIALQQAISQVYELMGKDLLAALPLDLNELKANVSEDVNNTGGMSMMGGGFTVGRDYVLPANNETSIKINIVANSPMISSISMMINNPMMLSASPDMGKSIKIGNRRGLYKAKPGEKNYELMLPLSSALITITGSMIKDDAAFMALVTKLDIEKIAKVLSE